MTLILALIGFIALTLLGCFYVPRCLALAGAMYLFDKLGLIEIIFKTQGSFFAVIFGLLSAILIVTMGYLDWKNLHLNPFKK